MLSRATDVEAVVSFFPEKYNDHKFLRCGRTAAFKRDPLYQLQQTVAFSKPEGVDVAQWREALRVRWDDVALPEASSTEQERAWFNRVARDIFTDCYRQFGFEPRVRGHLLEFARLSNDQRATSCLEGKLRRSWPAELPKARPLTETVDAAQKLMERERRQAKHAALAKWRDRMRTNGTALTAWLKRKWQPLPHTFWRVVGGQRLVASSYAHALGFIVAFWHDIWDRDVQCPAVEALGQVTTAATPMEGSWRLNVKEVAAAARQCQGAPGPDGRQPDELSQLPDHAFAWFIELWERWVERQVFHFPEGGILVTLDQRYAAMGQSSQRDVEHSGDMNLRASTKSALSVISLWCQMDIICAGGAMWDQKIERIATVGAAARADCDFGKNALQILTRTETISPPWKQFIPAGVEKALKIKAHKDQQRNRGFDIAQCVADVTNSASYIVRVILQIRTAARYVQDKTKTHFFASSASSPATFFDRCLDFGGSLPQDTDCADLPDPASEEMHLPMD
ncbi:hypothetical protein AK812_SmicGene16627 [Symbiodinium microadriaticum]|uniref:Uncharacterized protein n=1 Tax=Symbiodinium microadriaticum TaxID=2951 RepID=A0A1Q9DZT0_SYMMI|nr:hypothetical protein AK812_SmicGene16627 [Symbiodinium microadriaticum]